MTRLDQLATPTRRNGEHIRSVIERERQQQIEAMLDANALDQSTTKTRNKSRSMTHLAGSSTFSTSANNNLNGTRTPHKLYGPRPLRKSNTTKSMTQLVTAKLTNNNSHSTKQMSNSATFTRNRKLIKDSEIDSTTTNVSVAGVFL